VPQNNSPATQPTAFDSERHCRIGNTPIDIEACQFYRHAHQVLCEAGIPFLVGGAYALNRYTGIERRTKDLDYFVRKQDLERALEAFNHAGFRTEIAAPHWLAKAWRTEHFVDIIFASGNGVCAIDDEWFEHAVEDELLGLPVKLCPPEEIIWQKAYVQERDRYDGADIAHLIRALSPDLDWTRLLRRFGEHWRVLLSHLVLFGFIYPGERDKIPDWLMGELLHRLQQELAQPPSHTDLCRGTLLSRQQYLVDIEQWGYRDARL
jgi:hypothetical protein